MNIIRRAPVLYSRRFAREFPSGSIIQFIVSGRYAIVTDAVEVPGRFVRLTDGLVIGAVHQEDLADLVREPVVLTPTSCAEIPSQPQHKPTTNQRRNHMGASCTAVKNTVMIGNDENTVRQAGTFPQGAIVQSGSGQVYMICVKNGYKYAVNLLTGAIIETQFDATRIKTQLTITPSDC